MRPFTRLVGLETEYAIRYQTGDQDDRRPSDGVLFHALIRALGDGILAVKAKHFKEGVFLANGGAVWFEQARPGRFGLIEGATPECRGARAAVLYQRAQDRLLARAALRSKVSGSITLIKNDRDSRGNVYGAQENYECRLGGAISLCIWRFGLVLLLPLIACFTLAVWSLFLLIIAVGVAVLGMALSFFAAFYALGLVAILLVLLFRPLIKPKNRPPIHLGLFNRDQRTPDQPKPDVKADDEDDRFIIWLARTVDRIWLLLAIPSIVALQLLIRAVVFRNIRRQLEPFLVSRSIIAGSGWLDSDGAFHLGEKASAIQHDLGLGLPGRVMSIFSFAHFLKAVIWCPLFSIGGYLGLFAPRQRLQICLGDSNLCEEAEFLRVGATLLVIDAIEAGQIRDVPRVVDPAGATRLVCADPSLRAKIALRDGKQMPAIEMQRWYWAACQRYLDGCRDAADEAFDVLRRWGQLLDVLQATPRRLVGRVDWVTKQYLLEEAGHDATREERKKIDIRYHELSTEGYFQRLKATGVAEALIDDGELDQACRMAPPNTPAAQRGSYMREFAVGDVPVRATWSAIVVGKGLRARFIKLRRRRG